MKKIIALITAITVIISILNISAYATSDPSAMTHQEYYAAQSDLIEKYCNGDITFTEWQERQAAVNTEFLEANKNLGDTAYATAVTISNQFSGTAQKISSTVEKWGDGARERISDWWNGVTNNVPTENTQTSTTNMYGHGARVDTYEKSTGKLLNSGVSDYIIIDYNHLGEQRYFEYTNDGSPCLYIYNVYYPNSDPLTRGYYPSYGYLDSDTLYFKFYGDVRYEDGTQAPTDDEFEYGTIKKFDEMPERDLEDLINAFDEAIERNNPDLSTIEGLLRAIYARMGTLDSDNDNALLSSINANILALLEADEDKENNTDEDDKDKNDTSNEELVKILLEIRDILKDGTISIDYTEFLKAIDDFKEIVNNNNSELLSAIEDFKNIVEAFNYDDILKSIEDFRALTDDNYKSFLEAIENMQNEISDNSEELLKIIEDNNNSLLTSLKNMQDKIDKNNNSLLKAFENLQTSVSKNYSSILEYIKKFKSSFDDFDKELLKAIKDLKDSIGSAVSSSAHGHEISGTLYNVKPLDKNWFNKIFHGDENLKVEYEGKTYYLEDCGCLNFNGKYYQIDLNYDTTNSLDFDFNGDEFEINVKFADDKDYSEIKDNLGTLRDLLPQNQDTRAKAKSRSGISTFSIGGEKSFLNGVLSTSQNTKINKIMSYVEDYIAMGVPFESIQENLSIYETIIFDNGYTPEDLKFTMFGEECVLLSYQSLISSDDTWENVSEYTNSLDIVKAFTSILISFWWVLSMYKKLSNLI